jgi:hypothetical protein
VLERGAVYEVLKAFPGAGPDYRRAWPLLVPDIYLWV